jgi:hypothetical protein
MNITNKLMFREEVQQELLHINDMNFYEFVLLFTLCYLFTRMLHYFGGSYVN